MTSEEIARLRSLLAASGGGRWSIDQDTDRSPEQMAHAELTVAAVNALPELLTEAEACDEWRKYSTLLERENVILRRFAKRVTEDGCGDTECVCCGTDMSHARMALQKCRELRRQSR